MFEQQIEETISSIKRRTIGDNSSIPLKAVLAGDIPQAVKTYFSLDVKQWMKEEHDRLLNSPHFDYSDDAVRLKFRDIEQHAKPMIRFSGEEFHTVLDQAVKLHFNYICRPQWTLSKFVFGEKDLVTSDTILDALEYFVEYEYFKLIIREYLRTKNYTSLHRDRFEELVATIDTEVTKGFDSRKMAHVAQPLFAMFSSDSDTALIPIEALSVFYDDKNISPIVERLDAEKESMPMLSMHDLTVLISEVDFSTSIDISNLVTRHLYPEKQPTPARSEREPTDEELTRSIIAESRGERMETPAAPPQEFPDDTGFPSDTGYTSDTETEESGFEMEDEEEDDAPLLNLEDDDELPEFQNDDTQEDSDQPEETTNEEAALPDFREDEDALPDFTFNEESEAVPEDAEIPSFQHVPDTAETSGEEESDDDFSFSFEADTNDVESEYRPSEGEPGDPFQNVSAAGEEEYSAVPDDDDMDTPEAFSGFRLSSEDDDESENETFAPTDTADDLDLPEEFEGFTLAPEDDAIRDDEPPAGEHDVPEFPDFETSPDTEPLAGFGAAGDVATGGNTDNDDDETGMFDDFLPVEDDATPAHTLPVEERLEESAADDNDDFNLSFTLGNDTDTPEADEPESFDSFLADLDEDKPGTVPSADDADDTLSFLDGVNVPGSTANEDEMEFIMETPAATPGDDFSFEGDFAPPESDISFEEAGRLVNEEQKNEFSGEDDTHFKEFEFEPPDDDSLILPELDLGIDENDPNMGADNNDVGGFDFGEALAAEQEEESQSDMQDLMKDFVRDQTMGPNAVDDPIATLGDLKQTIPAKDRKLYVKALFNKDEEAFEAALNELNRKRAWREASEYIDELFIEHDVDMYSKVAIKFTDEIYKRYMPKG